ncbi:MAG: hypothetical protein ACKVPY_09840 [Paracoccaceae bacterium]
MPRCVTAALAATLFACPAAAGPIGEACLTSGRDAATRAVCLCIQQVADVTLSTTDQRLAARFFEDPEAAQRVKLSDSDTSDAFWQRYSDFGEAAEMVCSG